MASGEANGAVQVLWRVGRSRSPREVQSGVKGFAVRPQENVAISIQSGAYAGKKFAISSCSVALAARRTAPAGLPRRSSRCHRRSSPAMAIFSCHGGSSFPRAIFSCQRRSSLATSDLLFAGGDLLSATTDLLFATTYSFCHAILPLPRATFSLPGAYLLCMAPKMVRVPHFRQNDRFSPLRQRLGRSRTRARAQSAASPSRLSISPPRPRFPLPRSPARYRREVRHSIRGWGGAMP